MFYLLVAVVCLSKGILYHKEILQDDWNGFGGEHRWVLGSLGACETASRNVAMEINRKFVRRWWERGTET